MQGDEKCVYAYLKRTWNVLDVACTVFLFLGMLGRN